MALEFHNGQPDCVSCIGYVASQPHLVGACASVGIEFGKTTAQMLREHLSGYHARGHKEYR